MNFNRFLSALTLGMSLSGAAWGSLNSFFDNEGKRLHVTAVGAVQKALKNEGWTADEINQFLSIPVNTTTARANEIRRAAIEAHVRRLAGTDTPVAIAAMAPAAVAAAAVGGDAQPERPVAPSRQSQASASAASATTGGPEQAQQQPVARTTPMAAAAMARAEALGDPDATSTPARAAPVRRHQRTSSQTLTQLGPVAPAAEASAASAEPRERALQGRSAGRLLAHSTSMGPQPGGSADELLRGMLAAFNLPEDSVRITMGNGSSTQYTQKTKNGRVVEDTTITTRYITDEHGIRWKQVNTIKKDSKGKIKSNETMNTRVPQ